jgi:hypothetical protein
LLTFLGCNSQPDAATSDSEKPATVTMEDVKRDAATSMETTATYSRQNKDKLMKELKEQMTEMDAKIEDLRVRGVNLASDAKVSWELKMTELDIKRKAANAKLVEIENSTAQAWVDVEKGARSAWEDLKRSFQNASDEF